MNFNKHSMLRNCFLIVNLLFASLTFINCGKNNDSNSPATFTWTHEGITYTANLSGAYEQSMALALYNIVGVIGTNININYSSKVSFSLSAFNTGSYTIVASGSNRLSFTTSNGNNYSGVGGQLNITSNSNNRLSGNFSVTVNTPSPNTILTGSFSNIPVQP